MALLDEAAVVLPDELPTLSADDALLQRQREARLKELRECAALLMLRARDSETFRFELMAFYSDLQQLYQSTQRRLPWAIVDRVGGPLPLAERFRVPRLTDEDWHRRVPELIRPAAAGAMSDRRSTAAPAEITADLPRRALSRPAAVQPRRMGDLLRPRADDRRGDPAPGRAAPGRRPRRLRLRQVLAGPRRRPALAGARPRRQRRAVEDRDRPPGRRPACATSRPSSPRRSARRRTPTGDPAAAWHDRLALGRVALPDIQAALDAAGASLCLLDRPVRGAVPLGRDNREEAQLVTELLRLIAEGAVPRLFVILTMRSDYLGACAGFEGFAETVNRCQYLLPRMDDFALLRAIHEPAPLYGGTVAAEVGDRLLFEARREQDPLPVLQHTLMRACRRARERHGPGEGWTVTAEDVAAVGGADGALAAHAEEVLASVTAGDESRLRAAEWVFRTITDLDAEGRLVRRPRRLGELVDVAGDRDGVLAVVEAFRAPAAAS